MKLNRNYITPFISLAFLAVGVSGILMFFHLFDGYTEGVHEMLGFFFIISAICHILINWKALKIHFTKGVFISATIAITIIYALLIYQKTNNQKVNTILLEDIMAPPV